MTHKSKSHTSSSSAKKRIYKLTVKRAKVTGIMCLFVICVVLLFISPLFNIKTILVKGNNRLSSEDVLKAAAFSRGDNIFSINTSKAKENIENLDRVDSCKIERSLPGKVTVTVNEETESGYIKVKSGYAGIDENGKVLVVTKNTEAKCPLISGMKIDDPKKDDYIKSDDKNAKEKTDILIRMLSELEARGMIAEVKSIDISDTKNISLTLVTKTVVNFGKDGKDNEDKLEYKIAFLKAILDKDYPKNGGIIELSDTSNVTSRVS